MIGSGLSDPPDDGSCADLLRALRDVPDARLVWDDGGLIRAQYDALGPQTFARQWLEELLVRAKVVAVSRIALTRSQSQKIRATGLVGEDLNYYVRTAAASPDRRLVSHDTDYDRATCKALKKEVGVLLLDATGGTAFAMGNA